MSEIEVTPLEERMIRHLQKKFGSLDEVAKKLDAPDIWYSIGIGGNVLEIDRDPEDLYARQKMQAIGNCFESEKDAEEAVKKLQAWKRLKDCGFRFRGWGQKEFNTIKFTSSGSYRMNDFNLIFGGENG